MEVMFTHEELISRGFEKWRRIYTKEYATFNLYADPAMHYEVPVWITTKENAEVNFPNCRTIADLDSLIKLFTV